MYINMTYTRSDSKNCTPVRAKGIWHKVLAAKKEDVVQEIQKYWPLMHDLPMIDGMAVKGRHLSTPSQLQLHLFRQLYSKHMGIEKPRLFSCKLVY